jgi:uncharacterized membrane protein YhaH (DUF805 family)
MDQNRRRALWWLIGCLALAAVLVAMTANRVYNAVQLEQGAGANAMSWDLITQAVQSLALAAVVAIAGLVPAAWIGLRGRAVQHVVHAPRPPSGVAA